MKAVIFDLDGVIVNTARYHYLAWRKLARDLGFEFGADQNERLKGVSRMESLEIVLEQGHITNLSMREKEMLADKKNQYYQQMISNLSEGDILPGIPKFLKKIKLRGYASALGSASKSAKLILARVRLDSCFDAVVDGGMVERAKPNPDIFQKAADLLKVPYQNCIVVEDAAVGIEAAKNAGMKSIGIGDKDILFGADIILPATEHLADVDLEKLF